MRVSPDSEDFFRDVYFGQMFREHYGWLRHHLRRRVDCAVSAEDLAAETFAQVLRIPHDGIKEPRALLRTIAKRLVFDSWRRRDLERSYLEMLALRPEATHPSPEEQAEVVATLMEIDRMFDGLPAKAKTAFLLSQIDGLGYAEIALRLGVSVSMVRQYMARALRNCLAVIGS